MKPAIQLIAIAVTLGIGSFATAQLPTTAKPNLLKNPAFEDDQKDWNFSSHQKKGAVSVDTTEKHEGKNSIRIDNPAADDSFLRQPIVVKPKTRYRFTGYIKTKEVLVKGTGATLALEGGFEHTESISGNQNWKKVSFEFDSGPLDVVRVGPRLGHHSSLARGVAWFDDLQVIELGPSRKR